MKVNVNDPAIGLAPVTDAEFVPFATIKLALAGDTDAVTESAPVKLCVMENGVPVDALRGTVLPHPKPEGVGLNGDTGAGHPVVVLDVKL